ncbi:MAG TPA: hypothetical protein DCW31_04665 [Lactobacillus sp.]|nr:hypothetical protein [Lactobacillus sp.]
MAFLFNWATMEPDEYALNVAIGSVVRLGERNYLRVDGEGDETSSAFKQNAAAMLALGDYLTQVDRHGIEVSGFRNFVHYPLDVSWEGDFTKPHARYQMRMKQPNFMPASAFESAKGDLKDVVGVEEINYERFEEGLEAQVAHTGEVTVALIDQLSGFIADSPFEIDDAEGWHRELYLNDITKLPVEQWKIILRQRVSVQNRAAANNYPLIVN